MMSSNDTRMRGPIVTFVILTLSFLSVSSVNAQAGVTNSPQQLLDEWVALWGSYDIDRVSDLFIQDERLTYFSSETEGLIVGFGNVVEHHRGFGFTSGGSAREQLIWVEDVSISDLGGHALVAAVWYFGTPDNPGEAQRGPMSLLAVETASGYRIAHMHFATYAGPQP